MPAFIPPRLGQQDHHVGGAQQLYTPSRHVIMKTQLLFSADARKSLSTQLVLMTLAPPNIYQRACTGNTKNEPRCTEPPLNMAHRAKMMEPIQDG
jgi:hypothetical protein